MGPLEGTGLPLVSGRATFNECWCELQLSRCLLYTSDAADDAVIV